jgi:hypothetical protein
MHRRRSILLVLCGVLGHGHAVEAAPLDDARSLFASYVARSDQFDESLADLYSDSAVIKVRRRYADGQVRLLEVSGVNYKKLVRAAIPVARSRNDKSAFSEIGYTLEGPNVRITATRYSVLKQYSSPYSMLCGPSPDGAWLILEELLETVP